MKRTARITHRAEFLHGAKQQIATHIVDLSCKRSGAFALYGLAETRGCEPVEYIDITVNPQRRLLQHWMTARLWVSRRRADRITSTALQPLCHWIRNLYEQQNRLPVMVIYEWWPSLSQAESAAFAQRNCTIDSLRVRASSTRDRQPQATPISAT